jgi:hypothetical protein
MAAQFGVLSGVSGVTGVTLNKVNLNISYETAEAKNEFGQVTDQKQYSKSIELSAEGVIAVGTDVKTFTKLTYDGKDYQISSIALSTSGDAYQNVSITAKNTDEAAVVTDYVKGA